MTRETMKQARGTFEVKLQPTGTPDESDKVTLNRLSMEKQFQGDLEGTSKGEMLTAITPVKGSAGYVAIERVTGSLNGRSGAFVLQHNGIMMRGAPQQSVTIVPDSGTGQLQSLAGEMKIDIINGSHSYTLEYTLAEE